MNCPTCKGYGAIHTEMGTLVDRHNVPHSDGLVHVENKPLMCPDCLGSGRAN